MICFFFQAEDGIRDGHVTGVQTCALPILEQDMAIGDSINDLKMIQQAGVGVAMGNAQTPIKVAADWETKTYDEHGVAVRSEERRVGKECRCRWGRDQ